MDTEKMKRFFQQDAFATLLGIELADISAGGAVARMEIQPRHCNIHGTAHGGAIFTLADFAFQAACNSHGTVAVALNVNISYLRPAGGGRLTAQAVEVSRSKRIGTYDIKVTDEAGQLIATFHGMAFRKEDPIDWSAAMGQKS